MGKINKGILGGFNGKVGTVVGSSWKGISCMRSLAQSVTDRRTKKQMNQRSRFGITVNFLRPILDFIRTGFQQFAVHKTSFNAAMSYNIRNGIKGKYPECVMDYENALVARGDLLPADNASAAISSNKATLKWGNNSGTGSALASDLAMPLVLNTTKRVAMYSDETATRQDGTLSLDLPADWAKDSMEVYLSFRSADGMKVANSAHLLSVAGTNKPEDATKPATGGDTKPDTGGGTNTGETGIGG